MIELINVSKAFSLKNGTKTFKLNKFSLSLKDKGLVFVYGKSGSGKSTFLKLISGQILPDSGVIKIFNTNINEIKNTDKENFLINNLAYVPQDICLIEELNVRENLKFFLSIKNVEYDEKRTHELFAKLDLPIDYLDFKVNCLSSGEKQRIAIVRSILMDCKIILLDEPVSRIYKDDGENFKKYIKELSKDRLIIYVGHDINEFEILADEIIKFDKGSIVEHKILNSNCECINNLTIVNKNITNFWYFVKLGIENIKYRISKSVGLILLMVLSISIVFASNNMLNNTWGNEANELLIQEKLDYGIVLNNDQDAFDPNFKSLFNEEFKDEFFLTHKYYSINDVFPFSFNAIDFTNVFEMDLDKLNRTPFYLETGKMPSGFEFIISDALLFELWYSYQAEESESDFAQAVNDFNIMTAYNRLKLETSFVVGVFSLGNFEQIYKSGNVFSRYISNSLHQYSIYYSLMVSDFDEFSKLLEIDDYKEAISIPIYSQEILNRVNKFQIEDNDIKKINPLSCYALDEINRRQYFDIGALITLFTFVILFTVVLVIYIFGVYNNHLNEYRSLKNLGISNDHLLITYLSEVFSMILIVNLFGFLFSFLMDYLFSFLERMMFAYALGLTSFNLLSLGILAIIFLCSILISSFVGISKFKKR